MVIRHWLSFLCVSSNAVGFGNRAAPRGVTWLSRYTGPDRQGRKRPGRESNEVDIRQTSDEDETSGFVYFVMSSIALQLSTSSATSSNLSTLDCSYPISITSCNLNFAAKFGYGYPNKTSWKISGNRSYRHTVAVLSLLT